MPNSLSELHTLHAWEDNQITERCTQGEYAGKVLQFKLVDKDGDINLSNCLVQYAVTRPDKTEDLLDCTVDNGVVKCNLTYSATSISGLVHGEVRVIGSNNSGTIKFYGVNLRVYKGVSDEAVEQSDEFTALVAALQKVVSITPDPDSENTYVVRLDDSIVQNGLNPVASGVIYAALQVLDNAKIDKDKAVKYTGSNDLSECVDNGVLYRVHDGTMYQILLCNSGDAYRVQYMFKRSGEVVFRTSTKSNDTWGAWSTWSPIGTTSNIADGAVTTAKIADDLAAVINAKEVKSNKKTTLTGNENSDEFYPTTKAVADALSSYSEITAEIVAARGDYDNLAQALSHLMGFLSSEIVNNATDTGKIYYTTTKKALIIPVSTEFSQTQFRLDRDGKIYARRRSRPSTSVDFPAWGSFVDISAGVDPETVEGIIRQIVEAYIAEHGFDLTGVERTVNKVIAIGSGSTDTQYPSAKAVYNAIQTAIGSIETQLSQV